MNAAVPIPPRGILHMLNIRLQPLPPSSHASTHTMARMIVRSPYVHHINARSIVRSPDYSYDAVSSSYKTHFCCTTNAPGRKTYRKIYYISMHNARLLALQNMHAFVRAFFHANISKTDCEFLLSHNILVASDRATTVKGP